jgi:hypothetical protein
MLISLAVFFNGRTGTYGENSGKQAGDEKETFHEWVSFKYDGYFSLRPGSEDLSGINGLQVRILRPSK